MINYDNFSLLTALTIGLIGNFHCIGMCSGIITIFSMSLSKEKKEKKNIYQIYYNLGRILGYVLINIVAFNLGFILISLLGIKNLHFLKFISGSILIIISLYLFNVLNLIKFIELLGLRLWNKISKHIIFFFPIRNPFQAIFLGLIWAHVPCGLVYSTIIWSISSASFYKSISLIIFFGIGTLPSMIGLGLFSNKINKIKNYKAVRLICSLFFLLIGIYEIITYFSKNTCH